MSITVTKDNASITDVTQAILNVIYETVTAGNALDQTDKLDSLAVTYQRLSGFVPPPNQYAGTLR